LAKRRDRVPFRARGPRTMFNHPHSKYAGATSASSSTATSSDAALGTMREPYFGARACSSGKSFAIGAP
jgi:hypothetical protein